MKKVYIVIREDMDAVADQHTVIGFMETEEEAKIVVNDLNKKTPIEYNMCYYYEEATKISLV